jgi:hypothetical protein
MKITDLKNQPVSSKSKAKKSRVENSGFFDLLTDQLAEPAEAAQTSEVNAPVETSQLPPGTRLNGVRLSESSIDLLDNFGKALGDLRLKAEDLAPLVEALEGDTTALLDIKEQLPPDDPLALLIDRVTTISYIETEKFRRGDYK